MNLLEQTRWNYLYPWGNVINADTDKEICINEKLVTFNPDGTVHFGCSHGTAYGWKTDENSNIIPVTTQWSVGAIIAKDECRTHFGTYSFRFRLPNFRGSWPAIWLIDTTPAPPKGDGMGIPPEIDILEHFRKDGFFSRFQMHHAFHHGPTYANNTISSKNHWKLRPLDVKDIDLTFTWTRAEMTWTVDGKKILTVAGNTLKYPTRPMNLIINAGLGLDWKPNVGKFEDFVVYEADYQP